MHLEIGSLFGVNDVPAVSVVLFFLVCYFIESITKSFTWDPSEKKVFDISNLAQPTGAAEYTDAICTEE